MNSVIFGGYGWEFLHSLPSVFPNEVLSIDDSVSVIRFCRWIAFILPCRYCRESSEQFSKELGLFATLVTDFGYRLAVTRGNLARFLYLLHDKVNDKLGHERFKGTWQDTVRKRPTWRNTLFSFLYFVAWNYPNDPTPELTFKYVAFFKIILPEVLRHTDVGSVMGRYVKEVPPTASLFKNRDFVTRWLYNLRKTMETIMGPPWEFRDLDVIVEAFRARSSSCRIESGPAEGNKKSCM